MEKLSSGKHVCVLEDIDKKEFIDYWDTYSPVVLWQRIRLTFILAIVNGWHIQSIDFVLAFPQADVKTDIYMQPPQVPPSFQIPDLPRPSNRFFHVYKLINFIWFEGCE